MSSDEKDPHIEYIIELVNKQGIASTNTKDGHLVFVKRDFLQRLLNTNPDKELFSILLKSIDNFN